MLSNGWCSATDKSIMRRGEESYQDDTNETHKGSLVFRNRRTRCAKISNMSYSEFSLDANESQHSGQTAAEAANGLEASSPGLLVTSRKEGESKLGR